MAAESDNGLTVERLCKSYPAPGVARPVLREVSFSLAPGETLAVVGPSGSGKSTLLNLVGALDRPDSGRVRALGRELASLPEEERREYRRSAVGFVFQDHLLLPQCTALENVLLPAPPGADGRYPEARARELLDAVGLGGREEAFPAELSGGERQRVAVARALVNRPALLLCDEPTGSLDAATGAAVAEIFFKLARSEGMMLLAATHNAELAARCPRELHLPGGGLERRETRHSG